MDTEQMLQLILTKLDKLQTDVQELQTSNEAIKIQTAQLTEFRTEINEKLDQVIDDIDFLKSKEYQNEKDLFKLKKVIKLAE